MSELYLEEYNRLIQSFHDESDRASAILFSSYLEHLLEILLRSQMTNQIDDLFKGNGPFSTFSSRIHVAYCFGFITEEMYRDLNLIRKIRNEFAHSMQSISFDKPEIANRCQELNSYNGSKEGKDNRALYLLSAVKIAITLGGAKFL